MSRIQNVERQRVVMTQSKISHKQFKYSDSKVFDAIKCILKFKILFPKLEKNLGHSNEESRTVKASQKSD